MKLDNKTIGQRYAKAFYELSLERQTLDTDFEELSVVMQLVKENPELGAVLTDPRLTDSEKKELLATISQPFSQNVQDFLSLVQDYKRFDKIEFIIAAFNDYYNAYYQKAVGKVTSVVALDDDQKEKLAKAYAKKFGLKTFEFENEIDPSLIGGVIVEAQGQVIDGSVQTKLKRVKQSLQN
ncbi:ATP synthase F1 subunit delta [Holzapfeliella sp. He02]|uniref:ATP synthase subunit delta n=1 Tax=Holzapfeliella saturejae TaxID=3082953 RepID=A0ABU8SFX8_9LACO